jgi:hypothetical protein
MGGSDDPSNLVQLTIEEHAQAHHELWLKYQKKEDYLAYMGLLKLISKEEIIKELCSHKGTQHPSYGKRGKDNPNFGKKRTEDQRNKISNALKNYCKHRSESHEKNLRQSLYSPETNEKRTNNIAKKWKIIYPDGSEKIIHNISDWCKENNFPKSSVCCAFKTSRHYKNYFFEKVN